MPWAKLEYGSLALGLLKSVLHEHEIESDVYYLNLLFSNYVGEEVYAKLIYEVLVPEYVFTHYYYDLAFDREEARKVVEYYGEPGLYDPLLKSAATVSEYIDECLSIVNWQQYQVVGFTINFSQLLSSLCLAKALKALSPATKIIFGGSGCDGPMGREIVRSFPEVDYVFLGEAENSILQFVQAVLSGNSSTWDIGGLGYRTNGKAHATEVVQTFVDLNKNPYPDYGDYSFQKRFFGVKPNCEMVYLESSRGCWWGEKNACKFCGLNQLQMTYRSKSQERFLAEIRHYVEKYDLYHFYVADNILDMKYFDHVIPELIELRKTYPVTFSYEVKSNLARSHVTKLRKAGVTLVQAGVESFNDHILGLMSKGASEKHSIQIIKYCTEDAIDLHYNMLSRFPGEKAEDYEMMIQLVPYIQHLIPPKFLTPVILERFSIYFDHASDYNIKSVRPERIYEHLFKDPNVDISNLAYHFSFEHEMDNDKQLLVSRERFRDLVTEWQNSYRENSLVYDIVDSHEVVIFDSRNGKPSLVKLSRIMSDVVRACLDEFTHIKKLQKRLPNISGVELSQMVDHFIDKKWVHKTAQNECIFLPIRRHFHATLKQQHSGQDRLRALTSQGGYE